MRVLAAEALGSAALHAEGDATQLALQYLLPLAWLAGGEGDEGGEGGEGEGGEGCGGGGYAERWARSKAQHSLQQDPVGKAQQDQDATGRVAHRERAVHTAREGRQQVPRAIGRLKKVRSTYYGHTEYLPIMITISLLFTIYSWLLLPQALRAASDVTPLHPSPCRFKGWEHKGRSV